MEKYIESVLGMGSMKCTAMGKKILKGFINSGGDFYNFQEDLVDKKNDKYIISIRLNTEKVKSAQNEGMPIPLLSVRKIKPAIVKFKTYCDLIKVNLDATVSTMPDNDGIRMLKFTIWRKKLLESSIISDDELNELLESCISLNEANIIKDIDDNYRNLDKWKPSPGNNILFITGLSGSGKSTLARELANQYGAKIIELDAIEHHASAKDSDAKLERLMQRAMEFDADYGRYSKEYNLHSTQDHSKLGIRGKSKFYGSTKRVIRYIVNELWHTRQLYIVEGIQIIDAYSYDELKEKPFVFKNTSMLTSMRQRAYRAAKKQGLEKPDVNIFWKDVWTQAAWYIDSTSKFKKYQNRMEIDDEEEEDTSNMPKE